MALESFSGIWSLDISSPYTSDDVNQGDDHLRGIKASLKQTFPEVSATVNVSHTELNYLSGVASNIQDTISSHNALLTSHQSLSQSYASHLAYSIMSLAGSTTEFSASTSLSLFTGFGTVGPQNLATALTASGAISVTRPGHYDVLANLCISASTAANMTVAIYVNDTASDYQGTGLVPAQGRAAIVAAGIVSAGASDEIRVRIAASTAKLITVKDGQLRVRKVN